MVARYDRSDPFSRRSWDARHILLWLPAAAWMAVIFRFSSIPGSQVPGRYGNLAHFVEYAVLAALLFLPALRTGLAVRRAVALALVFASIYAITDEFHQSFVPGRVPDVADWAVDTLGAALAAGLLGWWAARRKKAARTGRP